MSVVRLAAVQASCVLMDREATVDPDVFRLYVDTSSRSTVVEAPASTWNA